MQRLQLVSTGSPLKVLCLGAHCDDIEIGCGGTVLKLANEHSSLQVHWEVFSSNEVRKREATKAANLFLKDVKEKKVVIGSFRDGFFPDEWGAIKRRFEALKNELEPDLVLTHYRDDRHQDHRVLSDLTWNTFRNHLVLEYEIPKYDGDMGSPNLFVDLTTELCKMKAQFIWEGFESQRDKQWFSEDTLFALLRLRGMECAATSKFAEAFYSRKILF